MQMIPSPEMLLHLLLLVEEVVFFEGLALYCGRVKVHVSRSSRRTACWWKKLESSCRLFFR